MGASLGFFGQAQATKASRSMRKSHQQTKRWWGRSGAACNACVPPVTTQVTTWRRMHPMQSIGSNPTSACSVAPRNERAQNSPLNTFLYFSFSISLSLFHFLFFFLFPTKLSRSHDTATTSKQIFGSLLVYTRSSRRYASPHTTRKH